MGLWTEDCWNVDIETTGLLSDLKKQKKPRMHNLCAIHDVTGEVKLFQRGSRAELQEWLSSGNKTLIIHNGICYDSEALRFFGFDLSNVSVVDTLALSWYLEPERARHGLEGYGEEFGIKKPEIVDWESLTQQDYNHRVQEDCKIQRRLWAKQKAALKVIYGDDPKEIERFLKYLMWKMEMLRMKQASMWKLDVEGATTLEKELESAVSAKLVELCSVMPAVPKYAKRTRPAKPFLKNGELSATGLRWKELTEQHGLPFEYKDAIKEVIGYEGANAQSPAQIKSWLDSLGWVPQTFKYVKDDDGNSRNIPQINLKGGEVCDSIKLLAEAHPEVMHLEGLGILKHRWGMVKSFLKNVDEGCLIASAAGFTNTLRLQHSAPLANIPSIRVKYGKEIRSLLLARKGKKLLGSDLSSLEDRLKHHFQWKLDPEYVKSQMTPGFDPHLEIAVMAGLMTRDECDFYKWYKENN